MNDITLGEIINAGAFTVLGIAFAVQGWRIHNENKRIKDLDSWKTKIKNVHQLKNL